MRQTGHADLPLHHGTVPAWLADRMRDMGTLIIEALVMQYGKNEVLLRLSDPLWFQSFGAVLGMDWHSSGITTSVMYALKRGINARARELGLCVCGGRGKYSRQTPEQLAYLADMAGLDGDGLIRASRLVAKVDNNAIQDGFQLYQHNFIVTDKGDWAVVQQGMNPAAKTARRYHWCSLTLGEASAGGVPALGAASGNAASASVAPAHPQSTLATPAPVGAAPASERFVNAPHTGIVGENQGRILNLTDFEAAGARNAILSMTREEPERILKEARLIAGTAERQSRVAEHQSASRSGRAAPQATSPQSGGAQLELFAPERFGNTPDTHIPDTFAGALAQEYRAAALPAHHEVRAQDVDLRRLGAVLATSYETQPDSFENLLLTPGLGPRTLQSLALVSEVIHGTPSRFTDPARFSFAHGGKDGHPFPVPLTIYDESIRVLHESIEKSKLNYQDKSGCLKRLHESALAIERNCAPLANFDATIGRERAHSAEWGGRTCFD